MTMQARFAMAMALAWGATACRADVRPPAVAGAFYERMPVALEAQIDGLLRAGAPAALTGRLMAAVVPHAGYAYSGPCAASCYRLLATGQIDRVFILAPSHHVAFAGVAVPGATLTAYRTPLGDVPVDQSVCGALRGQPGFVEVAGADVREHAVEVHLPFLQRTVRRFRLVPLICGAMDARTIAETARALAAYAGPGTLMLASSDFTHYGPNYDFVPFATNIEAGLKAWLSEAAGTVAAQDADGFDRHCRSTGDTICGQNPIRILLAILRQGAEPVAGSVVGMATSGDVVGDYANSVSYAAIAFTAANRPGSPAALQGQATGAAPAMGGMMTNTNGQPGQAAFRLAAASQKRLLEIARQAIGAYLERHELKAFDVPEGELTTPGAVFVTLTQGGQLRGCIGTTEARDPLAKAVARLAVAAAVEDGRFEPLSPEELPRTHIEISVLSPMRRVESADAIHPNEHGVVVRRGFRSGLFLPQVWEHFATKEGFLDELCRQKAHLDAKAWKDPATELYVFTVFAFEEPAR